MRGAIVDVVSRRRFGSLTDFQSISPHLLSECPLWVKKRHSSCHSAHFAGTAALRTPVGRRGNAVSRRGSTDGNPQLGKADIAVTKQPIDKCKNATFASSVSRLLALNYRLLRGSKRVAAALATLSTAIPNDRDVDRLRRLIAAIPREWEQLNEPQKAIERRRAKLARMLREVATNVANDRDLEGLPFDIRVINLNAPPDERAKPVTLAQLTFCPFVGRIASHAALLTSRSRPVAYARLKQGGRP